jgi:hypothetical protein
MTTTRGKWVIFLVAFDDEAINPEVIAERIALDEDENLAAFMRGGEVLHVLPGDVDEALVEGYRREFEKNCLR